MKFSTEQMALLRKHASDVLPKLALSNDEYRSHERDWKSLNAVEKELNRAARSLADKAGLANDRSEARSIEEAAYALIELRDDIASEKDLRNSIGNRSVRNDADDEARRAARRPMPRDTGETFQHSSSYGDDGLDDEFGVFAERDASHTFALERDQSFAEFIERRESGRGDRVSYGTGRQERQEYRGLTGGGYLRSMIMGPSNEVERRALSETSDSGGGYTVPVTLSAQLIDRMRAQTVVMRAGARLVSLDTLHNRFAKVVADPVPAWRAENAQVAESDMTFTGVELMPKSLAVLVKVSREVLADSLNIEAALVNSLTAAMALEVDRVALLGSGTGSEPRGVKNFANLTPAVAGINPADYSDLIKARTKLRTANSDVSAFIMHPGIEGILAGAKDGQGQPLRKPEAIANTPMLTTTAIPTNLGTGTNESVVFAGDWRRLMIGVRASMTIEILKERYADYLQYGFLAHLRMDVVAEDDRAFNLITGWKP